MNVCASLEVEERLELWSELFDSLPKNYRWVMGTNWSVVERRADKSILDGRIMSEVERRLFDQLITPLHVVDKFPASSPVRCLAITNERTEYEF